MNEHPLTELELSEQQRNWQPTTLLEAAECWPAGWKVEVYDGGVHYTNGTDGWDWRSVALAARTYPGWHIVLRHGAGLSVYAPKLTRDDQERPDTKT